jgi:hypothetical protein
LGKESKHFYVEVKRENAQDHVRSSNFRENAHAIFDALPSALMEWLQNHDCRIQVKFPHGLSHTLVTKICTELNAKVPHAPLGVEQSLTLPRGSKFVLLRRESEQHYKMGFIGRIMLQAGVAVQANDPRNMPVQIGFDWPPNLNAIKKLIKTATRQLQNDSALTSDTAGFVVLQARGGEQLARMIEERFLCNFPRCCLGLVLVPETPFGNGQIVLQDNLDVETLEVMSYAAQTPNSLIGHALSPDTLSQPPQTGY